MDIKAALLAEHSKAQTLMIVDYIGDDQGRFDELLGLFLGEEYRVTQRAAWVVSHCAEVRPQLVRHHLKTVLDNLERPGLHDAVKRSTTKFLSEIELPEELLGQAATLCFDLLASPTEAVAIRVHAMTVLYNICLKEPDLADELKLLIEDGMEQGSAGFRSRGRRILKGLAKLQ
ncbi:MAG: hypothetical protein AAGG75_27480 [Bacteroidota bacterium]